VKLEWIGLANHAENVNGLLYMSGGGWDTLSVQSPLEGVPEGIFALMQGNLVVRLLLTTTETNREHTITWEIVDEDGNPVMKAEAKTHVQAQVGLPIGWDQSVNYVFPLAGIPLPKPANYTINLSVDGEFLGDRPFRVLKAY
jgi:hypothetical protein